MKHDKRTIPFRLLQNNEDSIFSRSQKILFLYQAMLPRVLRLEDLICINGNRMNGQKKETGPKEHTDGLYNVDSGMKMYKSRTPFHYEIEIGVVHSNVYGKGHVMML